MKYGDIHVDDIGTALIVELCDGDEIVDVSGASAMEIIIKRENQKKSKRYPATFVTDGADGRIQYLTVAGDLDCAGPWKIQAHVTLPGGGSWSSSVEEFTVHENL